MDSPLVAQLFRSLLSRRSTRCLRQTTRSTLNPSRARHQIQQCRTINYARQIDPDKDTAFESTWQQRTFLFPEERNKEFMSYPLVTSKQLSDCKERPRRVRMLLRDFIEDCLYNPHYGYFSKHAVIFQPGEPFNFKEMRHELDFDSELTRRYKTFEDKLDAKERNDTRQLWHTPTELFSPFYGEAIARFMVSNYQLNLYPWNDLLIYEMGAGNGTLMLNILDFIRAHAPRVYERTQFKIIEISTALASSQTSRVMRNAEHRGHASRIEVINRSIFDWDVTVPSPCFFLALEVFDNFAHDALRYHPISEYPVQAHVVIDPTNDMYEYYTHRLDPLAARFLRVRAAACYEGPIFDHPLRMPRSLRLLRSRLPLAPNLTIPEYIPTRLIQFFDILHRHFPAHKLISSDFHVLPDTVGGINAPVVQTRYQRRTTAVRTPLVHQGYFDILFPTDFGVVEKLYRAMTGKLTEVVTQEEFLRSWADVAQTRTRNGDNPMLSWYQNASVMVTRA